MYNPPSKEKWVRVAPFIEDYKEFYDIGYTDSKNGLEYKEPFSDNCHERYMDYSDELNYWYYIGYYDCETRRRKSNRTKQH